MEENLKGCLGAVMQAACASVVQVSRIGPRNKTCDALRKNEKTLNLCLSFVTMRAVFRLRSEAPCRPASENFTCRYMSLNFIRHISTLESL